MNNTNAIAVARGFQASVLYLMVSAMLGCASAGPGSGTNERGQGVPNAADPQELVDCLLPGQIRQLDETVTYLTERRFVRTTQAVCTDRGGKIERSEESTQTPSKSAK